MSAPQGRHAVPDDHYGWRAWLIRIGWLRDPERPAGPERTAARGGSHAAAGPAGCTCPDGQHLVDCVRERAEAPA